MNYPSALLAFGRLAVWRCLRNFIALQSLSVEPYRAAAAAATASTACLNSSPNTSDGRAGEGGPRGADRPLLSEGVPPRGHREVFKEFTRLSSRLHALVWQDQIPFLYEGFEEAVGRGEQTCTLRRGNKASFKDPCDLFDWLSKWHVAGLAVKMVLLQSPHIGLEIVVPTVHP